ncbi:hypothetical protein DOT_0665 [Desulfosporosinus sp. OT]|nr:hypothetical protein DOT_0665 [Desulfosporosinus sp. OT]
MITKLVKEIFEMYNNFAKPIFRLRREGVSNWPRTQVITIDTVPYATVRKLTTQKPIRG